MFNLNHFNTKSCILGGKVILLTFIAAESHVVIDLCLWHCSIGLGFLG